jgi:hypothetical protein
MDDGLQLDSCLPFERIVVRTRNSAYDLVVVSGPQGEMLIRGGRLFPQFRAAQLVGATASGPAVKLLGVYPGLCMEFVVDGRAVITSPVLEVLRQPTPVSTAA